MKRTPKNRKIIRLQTWDYRFSAAYFITICTQDREHYFGHIENNKMCLSPAGIIANILWYELKNRVPNIELGEFITMPNHMHGVLILDNDKFKISLPATDSGSGSDEDVPNYYSKISPKADSISAIIRSYKSAVTKHCNRLGYDFKWQKRFYDHIIRDQRAFDNISQYIIDNPANWQTDKLNKLNNK